VRPLDAQVIIAGAGPAGSIAAFRLSEAGVPVLILEKKQFTQYGLKKELKTGMSIVNDTINILLEKEFIKKQDNQYSLSDEKGLLELIAFLKPINKNILLKINTSLTKKDLISRLPKETIFCLDTALNQYTNYYESNRICIYATNKTLTKIKKSFFSPGKTTELVIFQAKPELTKKEIISSKEFNYTNATRTIIDLYCDNKAFLADKIIGKVK